MLRRVSFLVGIGVILAGCSSIPKVNTATISNTPASAGAFAKATQATKICTRLPDTVAMFDAFEKAGIRDASAPDVESRTDLPDGGRRVVVPTVDYDDGDVIVQAGRDRCFVGLRGMTPEQSFRLGQSMARHYGLVTNAELGQGLSDHAVQAWQSRTYPSTRVLVAAHKTWPWDRGRWPKDVKGAAVTLYHD